MDIPTIRRTARAMPLTSPAYGPGPYCFVNREYFIITYRTDSERLQAVVPEPLEIVEPIVKYEFIRMPDSSGYGNYTESGQVIPVRFHGSEGIQMGEYVHTMFLNNYPATAAGRELWGFPKKIANPALRVAGDTLLGTLDYGSGKDRVRVATGTMGFKYQPLSSEDILSSLAKPNFLLKILPHVDGSPRVLELVQYYLEDVTLKGAWSGPAALHLAPHALAPVADLPVLEVVSASHFCVDLTLGLGKVVWDYLANP